MKPTKQTVYLPTINISSMFVVEEGRINDNVEEEQGYFFTPEELNEYTANVIRKALETAVEEVKMKDINEDCHYEDEEGNHPEYYIVDKQSITDTFDQTYKEFEV